MGFWDGMNQGGGGFWGGMGASSSPTPQNKKPQPKQDLGSMLGNALLGLGKGIVHSAVNDARTIADLPVQAGKSLYYLSHGDVAGASKSQQNSFINKQYGSKFAGDTSGLGNAGSFALDLAGLKGGGAVANQAVKGALKTATIQGVKTGAGFGAGYGLTQSLIDNQHDIKHIGQNVLTNAAIGGALGGVAPGAIKGGEIAGKAAYKGGKIAAKEAEGYAVRNADKLANVSVALAQNPSLATGVAGMHPGSLAGGIPAAGYQAGAKAARFAKSTDKKLSYLGADGQPRVAVSNEGAKLNPAAADALRLENKPTTLRELLPHKEFEKDYKPLRDIPVLAAKNDPGVKAVYDPARKAILVDPTQMPSDQAGWRKVLLGERNHAVQDYEGHAQGTMPGETDPGNINPTADMQAIKIDMNRHQGVTLQRETLFKELRAKVDPKLPKKEYLAQIQKIHDKVYDDGYKYAKQEYEDLKFQHDELKAQAAKDPERIKIANKYKNSLGEAEAHRDAESTLTQKQIDAQVKLGDFDLYHGLDPKQAEISFKPQMAAYAKDDGTPEFALKQIAQEYADHLRQLHKETGGVHTIMDNSQPGAATFTRHTSNDPFYRAYYKEHGKPPTKAAWLAEATRQLERGKGPSEFTGLYKSVKDSMKPVKEAPAPKPVATPKADKPKPSPVKAKEITPPAPEPKQPRVEQNSLTKGAKEGRQNVSEELAERVSGQHEVRNTAKLGENATSEVKALSLDDAIQQAHDRMNVPDGKIDDKDAAFVSAAMERADAEGRIDDANAMHDALSNHLVKTGQTSQAAILLYNRSPNGMFNRALRDLKKAGVEITPALRAELKGMTEAIKATEKGSSEHKAKVAEFENEVGKKMPQNLSDKVLGVWKAGLLSGVKTQGGNFESNTTFGALKKVSDAPAAAIDKVISWGSGKRTKTFTLKGTGAGTKEGIGKGAKTLRTGIDERNIGTNGKLEQHAEIQFKNRFAQNVFGKPSNLVFRGMGAADQPFYYAHLRNTLYDLGKADGLNKGLKGTELRKHMSEFAQSPSDAAYNKAVQAARKGVLGEDNKIASAVSEFARKVPGGQVLVPFTKVPTNFLAQVLDYTPVGPAKAVTQTAVDKIKGREFDQRALSEALGKGITGAGLIYLGAKLAGSSQLSGDYPAGDQKEIERWKTEKITPNSVKLGGTWHSLNYLGPIGLLFGAGKSIHDAGKAGESEVAAAAAGLGKGLLGQSFLQGFSGFSDAIKDPQRNATSFIKSELGSLVPAWSNDAGNILDSKQRQQTKFYDGLLARIPGKYGRESLKVKKDAFGDELDQPAGSLNAALNPFKPSNAKQTPVTQEIDRLKGTGKDNFVMPTPDKTIQVNGETIKLTTEQQDQYNTAIGKQIKSTWGEIIKTDDYKGLTDEQKADTLRRAMQDIQAVQKKDTLAKIGQYTLSDKVDLTKMQGYVQDGSATPSDFVNATLDAADAKYRKDNGIKKTSTPKFKTPGSARIRKGRIAKGKTPHVAKAKVAHLPKPKKIKVNTAPNSKLANALLEIGRKA